MRRLITIVERLSEDVWHGTPHRFGEFSTKHIGTGEGAQSFGWGLYFAGERAVAEFYRDQLEMARSALFWDGRKIDASFMDEIDTALLSRFGLVGPKAFAYVIGQGPEEARKNLAHDAAAIAALDYIEQHLTRDTGRLYRAEIPTDGFLLWDERLPGQPENVRRALAKLKIGEAKIRRHDTDDPDGYHWLAGNAEYSQWGRTEAEAIARVPPMTGEQLYRELSRKLGSDKAASLALYAEGVPGLKYLDERSRAAGKGTYNYVIFDDAAVKIKDVV